MSYLYISVSGNENEPCPEVPVCPDCHDCPDCPDCPDNSDSDMIDTDIKLEIPAPICKEVDGRWVPTYGNREILQPDGSRYHYGNIGDCTFGTINNDAGFNLRSKIQEKPYLKIINRKSNEVDLEENINVVKVGEDLLCKEVSTGRFEPTVFDKIILQPDGTKYFYGKVGDCNYGTMNNSNGRNLYSELRGKQVRLVLPSKYSDDTEIRYGNVVPE